MSQQKCACPKCKCSVDNHSIEKDGQRYCCQSCATGHADGSGDCGHDCQCGESAN
ncbi:metallothionein [Halomonas sp. GFAJ-1]|uniref:metallothionein n=1 Tax=Halomonas sp. GFAJ-1 TaxID=1118153 RepID=UPI00023A5E24|nr:metallothionein [Halomonas sp. GFAJ-1]EHK61796.1 metallothionein [Halomonas sp. GFAJ-1]